MSASVQDLLDSLHVAATEEERRLWAVACARALGLGGMAVSLGRELVWFSDATSERLEDLQFVLGQGPGLLFEEEAEPTVWQVPNLGQLLSGQWPQYAAEAEQLGIEALFVWPVLIGAAQVGTMTGYRRTAGPLSARQATEGWLVADALARHVLSHWPTGNGDGDGNGPGHAGAVDLHRAEVHQATGALSERLGISLPEALDRLRAQAYTSGLSLTDTAHAIICREVPDDTT